MGQLLLHQSNVRRQALDLTLLRIDGVAHPLQHPAKVIDGGAVEDQIHGHGS